MLSICILTFSQGDIGPIWGTKESPSFNQLNTYEWAHLLAAIFVPHKIIFLSDISAICLVFFLL